MTLQDLAQRAARRHDRQVVGLCVQACLRTGLALTVAGLLVLAAILPRLAAAEHAIAVTVGAALIAATLASALVLGLRRGWRARRSPQAVLTRLDRALGLKSQLAGGLSAEGPFAPLARARAQEQAAQVDLRRDLPRARWEPTLWPLAGGALALALTLPGPPDASPTPAPLRAPAEDALATADLLDAAAAELREAARGLKASPLGPRAADDLARRAERLRAGAGSGTAHEGLVRAHLAQAAGQLAAPRPTTSAPSPDGARHGADDRGRAALSALDRYERALDRVRGELQGRAAQAGGGGGGSRLTAGGQPRSGGSSERARPGEGRAADARPGRPGGGGRRPGDPTGGAPARGASGSVPVAGRGEGPATPAAGTPLAADGQDAALRSAVGERGRATLVAVDELKREQVSPASERLLDRLSRAEEAALRQDPIPAERRRLIQAYLERIRSQ